MSAACSQLCAAALPQALNARSDRPYHAPTHQATPRDIPLSRCVVITAPLIDAGRGPCPPSPLQPTPPTGPAGGRPRVERRQGLGSLQCRRSPAAVPLRRSGSAAAAPTLDGGCPACCRPAAVESRQLQIQGAWHVTPPLVLLMVACQPTSRSLLACSSPSVRPSIASQAASQHDVQGGGHPGVQVL